MLENDNVVRSFLSAESHLEALYVTGPFSPLSALVFKFQLLSLFKLSILVLHLCFSFKGHSKPT